MKQEEIKIQNEMEKESRKLKDVRLFKQDCGTGWHGPMIKTQDHGHVIKSPKRFSYGLQKGSSDLVGWKTIEITPEMVGKNVAVFTSIEVKTEDGKASKEQKSWLNAVREAGGIAGIARNLNEMYSILYSFLGN